MKKQYKKGDIVPINIVLRSEENFNKVKFGVDVEIIKNTVYPIKKMNKNEYLIICENNKGGIKLLTGFSSLPYNMIYKDYKSNIIIDEYDFTK